MNSCVNQKMKKKKVHDKRNLSVLIVHLHKTLKIKIVQMVNPRNFAVKRIHQQLNVNIK